MCNLCNVSTSVTAKGRRQPKAVKPKKMIRLESKNIVYAACNNGSSAVITKDGALYMFGKDTAHCHQTSGKKFRVHGMGLPLINLFFLVMSGNVLFCLSMPFFFIRVYLIHRPILYTHMEMGKKA